MPEVERHEKTEYAPDSKGVAVRRNAPNEKLGKFQARRKTAKFRQKSPKAKSPDRKRMAKDPSRAIPRRVTFQGTLDS